MVSTNVGEAWDAVREVCDESSRDRKQSSGRLLMACCPGVNAHLQNLLNFPAVSIS